MGEKQVTSMKQHCQMTFLYLKQKAQRAIILLALHFHSSQQLELDPSTMPSKLPKLNWCRDMKQQKSGRSLHQQSLKCGISDRIANQMKNLTQVLYYSSLL